MTDIPSSPAPSPGEAPAAPAANGSTTDGAGGGGALTVEQITGRPGGGAFTEAQIRQMADWSVSDGSMSREEADAMLKSGGIEPPAADPNGDIPFVKEMDAAFPPGRPTDFQVPITGSENAPIQDVMEATTKARTWMADARLPAAIGNAIAEEADRVAMTWKGMNDTDRAVWEREQMVMVERTLGAQAGEKLALARQLVAELDKKHPGVKDFLEQSGIGSSAFVAVQIAEHAARLAARADAIAAAKK